MCDEKDVQHINTRPSRRLLLSLRTPKHCCNIGKPLYILCGGGVRFTCFRRPHVYSGHPIHTYIYLFISSSAACEWCRPETFAHKRRVFGIFPTWRRPNKGQAVRVPIYTLKLEGPRVNRCAKCVKTFKFKTFAKRFDGQKEKIALNRAIAIVVVVVVVRTS